MRKALVLSVFLILQHAALASAQSDNRAQAREHFEKGVAAFAEQRFAEAAEEFKTAYRLSPAFVVLYNIGQVNAALGLSIEAVDAYERYLKQGASTVGAARRREVEAEIDKQRARIGTITMRTSPEGAEVRLDGKLIGRTPLAPLTVNQGQHSIEASLAGHAPQARDVEVAGRAAVVIDLALEPLAPPTAAIPPGPGPTAAAAARPADSPPVETTHVIEKSVVERVIEKPDPGAAAASQRGAREESSVSWQRVAGVVVAVGGLATATVGGVIAFNAANRIKDIDAKLTAETNPDRWQTLWTMLKPDREAAQDRNRRGWIIAGVGGAVLAGGVLLVVTAPSRPTALSLAPSLNANGGALALVGRW